MVSAQSNHEAALRGWLREPYSHHGRQERLGR
jgi:hypothetical protein